MDIMNMSQKEYIVKVQRGNHFDELMTKLKYFAHAGIVTDVALVTGGEPLHVHNVIISCFSNYFEYLTENENIKYIIHADQRKTILEALIDYIYKGITSIPQMYKNQLVLAATSLHIRDFISSNTHDIDHCNKNDQATITCPNHKLQLSQKIWDARQSPSKTDVIFIVNNKHKVFAHACILSACSSFLLQIFTEHCGEKRKPYVVALRNIEKTDLELVLEFCYKGEVCIPFQDIQSVYSVADLLGIDTLCKLLITKQSANLTLTVPIQENEKYTNIIRTSVKPTALADLLRYERLVDVFIFTKQRIFKAHSVILSIYSVFFKELANFLNYNLKDVIILIENFNTHNIEALLEYMYIGEAKFEGNTEEFCEIMSEWLDLSTLPVSPEVASQTLTSIQASSEECENKINSAVSDETVLIPKTERREIVGNGKGREITKCKESSKKEKLINNVQKEPILLKKETEGSEHDSSKNIGIKVFDNKDKNTFYAVKNNTVDCDDDVPEFIRKEIENDCNRLDHNEFNTSQIKCIPGGHVHTQAQMKNQRVELECARQSNDKVCNTMGERHAALIRGKKKATSPRIVQRKCISQDRVQSDNNINQKSEKEDSEIDEPEKPETMGLCQTDESNDPMKKNAPTLSRRHKQRTFECQTCNVKFMARWEFKLHLSEHPQGNVLQCKHCQKVFNRPSELQSHLRSHTGARPLQCTICGMSFMGKNTLRKHEHIHSKNKTSEFECEVCKKTFSRKQYLQEHKRTHTGNKPYECDVCHKSFVGKTGLNHHKKIHKSADEKRSAVCEICGKSFTRHALWTHMKHHNKEQKCEFCSKCFATTSALKIHVAGTHLGCSSHHCSTCGKGFLRKGHLSRHLKTHEEGENIVTFACGQCPSKFKDESHLKAHVKRKHTEQSNRSQTCGICGKHFSTQSTLIYHQRSHFHERPHRCNLCGKTFAMPYQLRDHTKLHHNDEKHFSCTVCKKKCATQTLLNRHLLTHKPTFAPKSKPPGSFTCIYCDKTFPTKLALSNHSRTHNFSRPYQCNVCRKAFRYQDSLLKHLRIHSNNLSETTTTKELPCIYTIQVCRPSFASISSEMVENLNYASEQAHSEVLSSETVTDPLSDVGHDMCLNIPERVADDISLLQLKPVEETYLSQTMLQSEDAQYTNIQSIEASSICNVTVEKTPEGVPLARRPYSITIDGNLCCNTALSTDGDITPITLLPERSELQISDVDMSMSSHVLLPVAHSTTMIELTQLAIPFPPDQTATEFGGALTKDFSL